MSENKLFLFFIYKLTRRFERDFDLELLVRVPEGWQREEALSIETWYKSGDGKDGPSFN